MRGHQVFLIQDFLLSRACAEADLEMICLPGATAFVPALVVSGLPNNEFLFVGFLPQKKEDKQIETTRRRKTNDSFCMKVLTK